MARTTAWRSVAAAALAAAVFACKEEVTAPGRCPDLCPGDRLVVVDTVITGVVTTDTSIRGFTSLSDAPILVTSTQSNLEAYAVLRFTALPQMWFPASGDTVLLGGIDSVALTVRLDARDSNVTNTRLLVYRLPVSVDTSGVFDSVKTFFRDSLPIDSIQIPDSVRSGDIRDTMTVASFTPVAADSFRLALGFAVRADSATVAILASGDFTGTPARLRYYVHGAAPRDTVKTSFDLLPIFDTYVQSPEPPPPPAGEIVVGNQPSARSFLKFNIPSYYVDSVTVLRATLFLTPLVAATGFPGETFTIEAQPILRYFGGKSILFQDTSVIGSGAINVGQTTEVGLEVARVLRLWKGIAPDSLPRAVALRTGSELLTFGQLNAAGSSAAAGAPRLQVTFVRPFRFGVP
jgi:hypothetical protein